MLHKLCWCNNVQFLFKAYLNQCKEWWTNRATLCWTIRDQMSHPWCWNCQTDWKGQTPVYSPLNPSLGGLSPCFPNTCWPFDFSKAWTPGWSKVNSKWPSALHHQSLPWLPHWPRHSVNMRACLARLDRLQMLTYWLCLGAKDQFE